MKLLARALLALLLALLLLAGVLVTIGAFYRPNTQIPSGLLGKHLDLNGLPIRVYQRGSGQDVLLIHGSPGSLEDFLPVLSALSGRFRVTAYDRPGHGFSGDTGTYSPSANADIAEALLAKLDMHDTIVVGHSYGGSIALAIALRRPTRTSAYVVLDSATYTPLRDPSPLYKLLTLPYLGIGCASVLGTFIAPTQIRQGLVQVWNKQPPPEFVALRTRIWSTPKVSYALARETSNASSALAAQSPRYPEIEQPVAILAQADDVRRKASAERLHSDIKGSTLQLLSGTGHYLQFEKTDEVVRTIESLAKVEEEAQ
jgi:pimeloyl-ACP methyl ester carboxylesterase